MKKAETFERWTGQNIYREITRKKIDPALLIKAKEGSYYLNVFPIRKNKTTKVIIDYYSILETDTSGLPVWYFSSSQIERAKKSITFESQQPANTLEYIKYLNKALRPSLILTGKPKTPFQKTFKQVRLFYIRFDYNYLFNDPIYYNSKCQYLQTPNPRRIDDIKKQKAYFKINTKEVFVPQALKKLLEIVKQSNETNVEVFGFDEMTYDFLNYLRVKKNISLNSHNNYGDRSDDKYNWYNNGDKLIYTDSNFQMIPTVSKNKVKKIYCPFLDIYIDYLKSLSKPFSFQEEKGYLNSQLSKIIIEDDSRSQQTKERWVKAEMRGKSYYDDLNIDVESNINNEVEENQCILLQLKKCLK